MAVLQRHGCQLPLKSKEEEIHSVSGTSVYLYLRAAFVAKRNQNLIIRQIFTFKMSNTRYANFRAFLTEWVTAAAIEVFEEVGNIEGYYEEKNARGASSS